MRAFGICPYDRSRSIPFIAFAAIIFGFSQNARAQDPPPLPPPAGTTYVITAPTYPPPPASPYPSYPAYPGPRVLDYEEGDPIPPGYHKVSRVRTGLVIGGSVSLGLFYLTTLCVAAAGQIASDLSASADAVTGQKSRKADFGPLLIPVAGPFIGIGTTHANGSGAFGLAFLGIGQTAGLAMLVSGLAFPKTRLVRDIAKPSFTILPATFGAGSAGLGIIGSM